NSVINNIFTNAIKFSYPDSKIIVTAEPAAACVKFSIRDFGIGMPGNLLKNLFDVRKTTSRMGTEGEEGTGFGMPLMKKFVNAYGGAIEIFSKAQHEAPQNHGTTVVISCPEGK
ncbi:MAG: ATP-binding protein, partial [Gammaproteobacteria bacterium]|nr:ATP-binding protein [Gammaproteobacteria bacterium]